MVTPEPTRHSMPDVEANLEIAALAGDDQREISMDPTEDLRGTAAIALTALSSSGRVLDRDAIRSWEHAQPLKTGVSSTVQGAFLEGSSLEAQVISGSTTSGGVMRSTSEAPIRSTAQDYAILNTDNTGPKQYQEGSALVPMEANEIGTSKTTGALDSFHPLPASATNSTLSSGNRTPPSLSTGTFDIPSRDRVMVPQYPLAPSERIQSLSHLLEDQLSLELGTGLWKDTHGFSSDKGTGTWTRVDRSQGTHVKADPVHHGISYSHDHDGRQYEDEHSLDLCVHPAGSQPLPQANERAQHLQESRSYPPPSVGHSISSALEGASDKSKRKHLKKSIVSKPLLDVHDWVDSHSPQECKVDIDQELDLRAQIPKKGRPISKHSSSSQGTSTLASVDMLSRSQSNFNFQPVPSQHSCAQSIYLGATMVGVHPQNPVRRRPGRPPAAPKTGQHVHSRSNASLQSGRLQQDSEAHISSIKEAASHVKPPLPRSSYWTHSPSSSWTISAQQPQEGRHSYNLSYENRRFEGHSMKDEHSNDGRLFQTLTLQDGSLSSGPQAFAEGISARTNTSSHSRRAEKRRSTEDHYFPDEEKKSDTSSVDMNVQGWERPPDRHEHTSGGRSRKRQSRLDFNTNSLDLGRGEGVELAPSWHGNNSDGRHQRPRSMMLLGGHSDSSLRSLSSTPSNYELQSGSRTEDDDSFQLCHERTSRDTPTSSPHSSGRLTHGYARSLDLSNPPSFPLDRSVCYPGSSTRVDRLPDNSQSMSHRRTFSVSSFRPSSVKGPSSFTYSGISSDDYRDYQLDSAMTEADRLAHGLSGVSSLFPRQGQPSIASQTKTPSRRPSGRGPGPYLKKHQILQQQLHQMQREQDEIEVLQRQQRQFLPQPQHLQQQRPTVISRGQLQQQELLQRPPSRGIIHAEQEILHQPFHLYQQQKPQPGRPPKQRVLMRSESASSAIHSLCSSTTSSHSQGHTPAFPPPQQQQRPSSQQPRRRQNLHQPILLRPVSLPSLTEVGPSSLYHSRPPPGQPLYQSLPYQASPSSLISVSSAASSGTGLSTGTGSTLHMALGIDIGGVDAEPPLTDVSRGSSPVHSPETLFLSTAPLSMPRSGFDHSPPRVPHTHNQQDAHWYSQEQEQRDGEQEHLHHNQQQQQHHRLQSRHLSGDSIMDKGQRSSVSLSRSNSRSGGGGMSVSSSSGATTLVSSSSMQSLHRHSASLPALRHDFLMQGPMSSDDPVHPSTYRKNSASHVDHVTPKAPRKTPSPPTFTSSSSSSFLQKPAAGDEDSVQGLMIKLPPNDV